MESLSLDIILSLPILVLSLGSFLILLAESFVRRQWSRECLTLGILVAGLVATVWVGGSYVPGQTIFFNALVVDPFSYFIEALIILGSILSLLLGYGRLKEFGVTATGEYCALFLMSTSGALIFATAGELITLFVGLEIMSVALYCLCASALKSRRSSESGLKYFLLGSFSSAFMLYGIALCYGITGSTVIADIGANLVSGGSNGLTYFAIGMIIFGFGFKIAAVPFHFWAPDVYEGAPTTITAYMACVIKAAAVAALLRGLWGMFGASYLIEVWSGAIWIMSILSMCLGNFVALRQRSVKRMLAYSSIAHVGYLLVAVLNPQYGGGAAILYYLVAYTLMTLGAFGVSIIVAQAHSREKSPEDISNFNGLGLSKPMLGLAMTVFMFSLAGLPPGLAGLLGKFYLFNSAIQGGYTGLVIIAVINSAISCYYYLRVLVAMYFVDAGQQEVNLPEIPFSTQAVLSFCALASILIGLFPGFVHDLANSLIGT